MPDLEHLMGIESSPVGAAATCVAILANPRAGSERSRRIVAALVRRLDRLGLHPVVCWHRRELSELVQTRRDELRCIVAAGGDGTVLEVINRAPGLPVAVLPLGTENLTARYLGIGRDPALVAATVAAGRSCVFDLGQASGRAFALMAGAGFDAEVVQRVHRRRRGHIGRFSYALPILQALQEYRFPAIEVEVADTGERLHGALLFVFNLPCYGLGLPIGKDARPDDGWLDLYVFETPGGAALLWSLAAVWRRRHTDLPDVHHRRVRRARLTAASAVPLQLDGDPAGTLPVEIGIAPRRMTLLAPPG
jgi:YegS/Rv2252/BmrU family lipid kinase